MSIESRHQHSICDHVTCTTRHGRPVRSRNVTEVSKVVHAISSIIHCALALFNTGDRVAVWLVCQRQREKNARARARSTVCVKSTTDGITVPRRQRESRETVEPCSCLRAFARICSDLSFSFFLREYSVVSYNCSKFHRHSKIIQKLRSVSPQIFKNNSK